MPACLTCRPACACLQTRGILTWVNDASPGAYHSDVQYVTVAGKNK
jgi:hypothetical protein